jgi:hypothetical protein
LRRRTGLVQGEIDRQPAGRNVKSTWREIAHDHLGIGGRIAGREEQLDVVVMRGAGEIGKVIAREFDPQHGRRQPVNGSDHEQAAARLVADAVEDMALGQYFIHADSFCRAAVRATQIDLVMTYVRYI